MAFAKLYESDDFGQVLLLLDQNEQTGQPELRWMAQPPGCGVCSYNVHLVNSEDGQSAAHAAFEKAGPEQALTAAFLIFSEVKAAKAQQASLEDSDTDQ
ncbi:MAG: hypothetical protein E6R09_02370 [Rhodocyclaceae bacterium]|nr:MAG: hypothetical protein E6R09_02370 [Rhodocyclaceae bacterium]